MIASYGIILLAGAAGFFSILKFHVGVRISVFLLPFSGSILIPREMFGIVGLNSLNVVLAGTIIGCALLAVNRPKTFRFPLVPLPLKLYIVIFCTGALIGLFSIDLIPLMEFSEGNFEKVSASSYLLTFFFKPLLIIVIMFLVGFSIRHEKDCASIFLAGAWALLIFSSVVLADRIWSELSFEELAGFSERQSLSWTGMHANDLGQLLTVGSALTFFAALGIKKRQLRWFYFVCAILSALAAVLTFSRAAFFGLFLIAIYVLLSRRKVLEIGLTILAFILISFLIPEAILDRAVTGVSDRDVALITAGRWEHIWKPLLPEFSKSPIWGGGLSSILWSELNSSFLFKTTDPHNAYLGVVLDLGVLGLVVVGLFWFSMWRSFRVLSRHHPDPFLRSLFRGSSLAILLILAACLTGQRLTPWLPHYFIWVTYGMALGVRSLSIREGSASKEQIKHMNAPAR